MEKNDLSNDSQQARNSVKVKKGLFSFLSKICFWIGVVLLFFAYVPIFTYDSERAITGDLYWGICWSFLYILAPFFGIIGNVGALILHRGKRYFRYICRIILEITVLVIFGLMIVPYICTAPALDKQNLEVYGEMIDFVKDYKDLNRIDIDCYGHATINNNSYSLNGPYHAIDDLEKIIAVDGVNRLRKITKDFFKIRFFMAFREYDFVFFINRPYGYKPQRFGAVYSLDGRNPNDIDIGKFEQYRWAVAVSEFKESPNDVSVNTLKEFPFIKIKEDWYTSRKLIVPNRPMPLIFPPWPRRASLIDHSLRIESIDFRDVNTL